MKKAVTNSDLMAVLGDMREDLGGIKAQLESHTKAFTAHLADDQAMAADVRKLQLSAAGRAGVAKGRAGTYGFLGSVFGAVAAFAVEWFKK